MNETISLFDKYGGVPTITEVVRAFYKKVLGHPDFKQYFENIDMEKLIMHQIEFISLLWVSRNLIILTLDYMMDIKFEN